MQEDRRTKLTHMLMTWMRSRMMHNSRPRVTAHITRRMMKFKMSTMSMTHITDLSSRMSRRG